MDAVTMLGALAFGEGANGTAILAPAELPPGHISWTTKDIVAADSAFATTDQPSMLQTWLAAGACLAVWKEATFEGVKSEEKKELKPKNEEPR